MRLLLDTQALIWIVSGRSLSRVANRAYRDQNNELLVSAASYWEVAIKNGMGKLDLRLEDLEEEMHLNRIGWLPIDRVHCRRLAALPRHHRDPFDRLLAAQALCEDLSIVAIDAAFDAYGVRRIW